jgi:quinol monooxygenase YgiN
MDKFVQIVDFEVQPGTADEVVKLVSENARKSVETEPGVFQFDVLRVADNPNRLILYEVYENEAAFQSHMKTPHLAAFLEKARPMFVKTTFTKTSRAAHPVKK